MARQGISTGSAPNDGTGDSLLVAARKINENFSELYGVVGDGTTVASGIITASSFKGDGAGLTGVTAESSGIRINDDGSLVGVAATINFGTNLSVTPLSAGIVTISASDVGITSIFEDTTPRLGGNLDLNGKLISGTGDLNLSGVITATSFDGTLASSNLSGALPALDGSNLTGLNATNLGSGTIPDARITAALPAISGANLTNLQTTGIWELLMKSIQH